MMSKNVPTGMTFLHVLINEKNADTLTICRSNVVKLDASAIANKMGLKGKWHSKFKIGPIGIQFADTIMASVSRSLTDHQLVVGKRVYSVPLRIVKKLISDAEKHLLEQFKGGKKRLEGLEIRIKEKTKRCNQLGRDTLRLEKQLDDAQKAMVAQNVEIKRLQRQIDGLKEIRDIDRFRTKLERTLATKQSDLDKLQKTIADLDRRTDELEMREEEVVENQQEFQGKIERCVKTLESLFGCMEPSTEQVYLEELMAELHCLIGE